MKREHRSLVAGVLGMVVTYYLLWAAFSMLEARNEIGKVLAFCAYMVFVIMSVITAFTSVDYLREGLRPFMKGRRPVREILNGWYEKVFGPVNRWINKE